MERERERWAMNIISKARGEITLRSQRVFLSCNALNVGGRDKIINDLLSHDAGMDCIVLYLEIPDMSIDEDILYNELRETQALVLWVTKELLQSLYAGNQLTEYRMAKKLKIPILPIAEHELLFEEFTRLTEAVHGIAMSDKEYRKKLKAQLETLLVSDDMKREIQNKAFTAGVFLSYRKMDIDAARVFMKKLHNIPEFEAVSIWYDNFLTAGRIFHDEIERSISESDAFVLLVTPNLPLKNNRGEDNYVVSKEYPFARAQNKPIISVETTLLSDDERNAFADRFPKEQTINVDNPKILLAAFRKALGARRIASIKGGEQAYLLGIAYLKGLGLEKDSDRAIRLLSLSAKRDNEWGYKSSKQLADIYEDGIASNLSFDNALHWRKRAAKLSERLYGNRHENTALAYDDIGGVYSQRMDLKNALHWFEKALAIREKALGSGHPDTIDSYSSIGLVYLQQGDYSKTLDWLNRFTIAKYNMILGKALKADCSDMTMAMLCTSVAAIYGNQRAYAQAIELFGRALKIYSNVSGYEHPDTLMTHVNIGNMYTHMGNYSNALECFNKTLTPFEKILGAEHPTIAMIYNNIGTVYMNKGDNSNALQFYSKALKILEYVYGKEHPGTVMISNNIKKITN